MPYRLQFSHSKNKVNNLKNKNKKMPKINSKDSFLNGKPVESLEKSSHSIKLNITPYNSKWQFSKFNFNLLTQIQSYRS